MGNLPHNRYISDKGYILTGTYRFIFATITALLSPAWYFLALKVTNGKIWVFGYLILLGVWIAQFIVNTNNKKWLKKHYILEAFIGFLCFIPLSVKAFTFLCWAIGDFAP